MNCSVRDIDSKGKGPPTTQGRAMYEVIATNKISSSYMAHHTWPTSSQPVCVVISYSLHTLWESTFIKQRDLGIAYVHLLSKFDGLR